MATTSQRLISLVIVLVILSFVINVRMAFQVDSAFMLKLVIFIGLCLMSAVAYLLLVCFASMDCAVALCLIPVFALLPCLTMYNWLSSNSLWCCLHPEAQLRVCDVAYQVSELLNSHNVSCWLCFGSLLAVERENGYHVPWEHDVDLCISSSSAAQAARILSEHPQFQFDYYPGRHEVSIRTFVDGQHGFFASLGEIWVDIYAFHHNPNSSYYYYWPTDDLFPLAKVDYCNPFGYRFFAPRNATDFVRNEYPQYRQRRFRADGWTAWACRQHADCDTGGAQ